MNSILFKKIKRLLKKIIHSPEKAFEMWKMLQTEKRSRKTWLSAGEIALYRKKIKIYDVFTFFNELDMLELRFNILNPYVDFFVVVEATKNFTGYNKPLYYLENIERFKTWKHKIIHYVVDDVPKDEDELRLRLVRNTNDNGTSLTELERQIINNTLNTDNFKHGIQHWLREFYIKESVKKSLENLNDDDICYISDVDEIWNPELIIDYSKDNVFKPIQTEYVYYLNNKSDQDWHGWTGTIVTKYKNIKNACLNHLRTHKKMFNAYTFLKNGGWHFSFQGGLEGTKKKIVESNNPEYYGKDFSDKIEELFKNNQDQRQRNIIFKIDEKGLPKHVLNNKKKYNKFFK